MVISSLRHSLNWIDWEYLYLYFDFKLWFAIIDIESPSAIADIAAIIVMIKVTELMVFSFIVILTAATAEI